MTNLEEEHIISHIDSIKLFKYATYDNTENKNYLVLENESNIVLLINLTDGIDLSFSNNKKIPTVKNKANIINLYAYKKNPNFYEGTITISNICSVKSYRNVNIHNSVSNQDILNTNFILELKDRNERTILVDLIHNKIYARENVYTITTEKNTYIENLFHSKNVKNFLRSLKTEKIIDILFEEVEVYQ